MNWMVLPNQLYLIVKLYINRPELLPDSNVCLSQNGIKNEEHLLSLQCVKMRWVVRKM